LAGLARAGFLIVADKGLKMIELKMRVDRVK